MKRSAQVALVLMGVTGATAAGAYMTPPRPECRAQPAASTTVSPPAAVPQKAEQPCRRRSGSWGSWRWGSNYSSYSSSNPSRPWYARRAPTSVSTALTGSRTSTSTSTSAPRSGGSSTAARGGFGATGHSMSGGHSGS